jgi:hypothetical protein
MRWVTLMLVTPALSRQPARAEEQAKVTRVSGSGDCCLPSGHLFGSKGPQRRSGDEVALKVEVVVDGGVVLRKRWADPADLNRCILRSRRRTA